jgi:translation initiation factor 6
VPVHEIRAAGTDLLGVFFAGNEDILLVPEIMFDSELHELKRLGIKYAVVKSELTALGNNVLFTENAVIVNPAFSEHAIKSIEKNTGLKVKPGKINELEIVGSLAKSNSKGFLVSPDIRDFEMKFLKTHTKQKITKGTLNFGSPNVSSAFVANENGFIVGDASGGPEIVNLDEALGFSEG